MVSNKLYLNKGNLVFEDITERANLEGDKRWYTGSTMVDINNDGYLDIYCSVSGQSYPHINQLFINNGDMTFTEKAAEYGLADEGHSIQASFFDYDRDGDLDVYVANYPPTTVNFTPYQYLQAVNNVTMAQSGHMYRNDNGVFKNVTNEAGMLKYSLSLGATVSDLNNDGWDDLYVSSDFNTPDMMYINNQDGTFTDKIMESTEHFSFYGMGVDIADYNNDGLQDIIQLDMNPASNRRSKANMLSMNPDLFYGNVKAGFGMQYMQNSLQIHRGNKEDGTPVFSDISRLAGVSSTDWSWSPLLIDLDNDGLKDLFVSNGTRREVNNRDYFISLEGEKKHKDSLLKKSLNIPSERIDNFVFKNNGDLTFSKVNEAWGISFEGFSNGSTYADLDNDGDIEIITNNIDDVVSIYENTSSEHQNFLTLSFEGKDENKFGIGTKAILYANGGLQHQQLTLTRGFQSSVAPKLSFGLGKSKKIDSIKIIWPDLKEQTLVNVVTNQNLKLLYANAQPKTNAPKPLNNTYFENSTDSLLVYRHKENVYDDFESEVLLPHRTSRFGPGLVTGDLNGDGLNDVYIGAAKGYPGGLFFQTTTGKFEQQKTKILINDRNHEDLGALVFDADMDGDNDLYIVSGGNEFPYNSPLLQDRLYVNDGKGNFKKSKVTLPKMISSGNRVYANDFDKDGDLDLFVTGRLVPGNYPHPANSFLLENISSNGNPKFKDITAQKAPFLKQLGLATSASFADIDKDGWDDLIVVGEWMPIKVFKNNEGIFKDVSEDWGLNLDTTGWWFSINSGDFDNDGDQDFIVGNLGLNYKYKAEEDETFDIYFSDFDSNNKNDIVLSYFNEGKKYPVRGRSCSSQQIPSLKKKFKTYDAFSKATLNEVYNPNQLKNALHYQVKSFASVYLENKDGKFILHQLPNAAQISPINQVLVDDYNKDGHLDALVAGNLYASEVETPRADAGIGLLLLGDGRGSFKDIPATNSGLYLRGDVKDLTTITVKNKNYILAAKNDGFLQSVRIK
ncbi:FG-GAP-like repeat-containing protein [Joostella atrarenae]|uniref:FG-GAP-like repeat-containing protein n=1 Tax=Joostella atrarenae TaxID=679257 RepID=UPI001F209AC3|nr:FG-GAP-like repeat-containing protein [Joostella atrarenae]